jgi:hypothetical protein
MFNVRSLQIVNEIGPSYLKDMFTEKHMMYSSSRIKVLEQPKYNTVKYGKMSFKYQGAKVWNMLSNDLKQAIDITEFKRILVKWNGPECNCSMCNLCILNML